jgi:hypothetical protein
VTSSADGNKMAAVAHNGPPDYVGGIYTSTNSGSTWTLTSAPLAEWVTIASSVDGTKLIAGDYSGLGSVYTSTNSGATWASNSISPYHLNWSSVTMSADGGKLVAGNGADGYLPAVSSIYTSTNLGASWQTNDVPNKAWQSVAISADGGKVVAVVESDGIYIAQTTPSPQLQITGPKSDPNALLCWTIPSMNFVLQQSTNLFSWSDATNLPVLNLTNLQNQVTFPPSGNKTFYRLKTP